MELPPLSPGIQDRVIEVVVVLVTVRRGWSGGTEGQHSKHYPTYDCNSYATLRYATLAQ